MSVFMLWKDEISSRQMHCKDLELDSFQNAYMQLSTAQLEKFSSHL